MTFHLTSLPSSRLQLWEKLSSSIAAVSACLDTEELVDLARLVEDCQETMRLLSLEPAPDDPTLQKDAMEVRFSLEKELELAKAVSCQYDDVLVKLRGKMEAALAERSDLDRHSQVVHGYRQTLQLQPESKFVDLHK